MALAAGLGAAASAPAGAAPHKTGQVSSTQVHAGKVRPADWQWG